MSSFYFVCFWFKQFLAWFWPKRQNRKINIFSRGVCVAITYTSYPLHTVVIVSQGIWVDLTQDLYSYYCLLLAQRGDPTTEGKACGGRAQKRGWRQGGLLANMIILQVSQFQEAEWPDSLGKHWTSSAQCSGLGRQEDESSLITKGSNCPTQPCPHPRAEL